VVVVGGDVDLRPVRVSQLHGMSVSSSYPFVRVLRTWSSWICYNEKRRRNASATAGGVPVAAPRTPKSTTTGEMKDPQQRGKTECWRRWVDGRQQTA
jgi:hypothetical protein